MKKNIYSLVVDCSQQRQTLSGLPFLRKKQKVSILNGLNTPALLMPPTGSDYTGRLSLTIINYKNETLIENLSRDFLSLTFSSVRPVDIIELTKIYDEIDIERSFVYIDTPTPNTYTVFYFIVSE